MSSTAEEINLSEHPQTAEPAENVTEVTEQSMRDLKWIWSRRAKLAEQVELLELGKAGGVSHKRKRTSGAMRQACVGVEKRRAVSEAPAAQEGGEEGGEKMLMREVKRLRSSALEPIFDEMIEFDGLMVEFVMACERARCDVAIMSNE